MQFEVFGSRLVKKLLRFLCLSSECFRFGLVGVGDGVRASPFEFGLREFRVSSYLRFTTRRVVGFWGASSFGRGELGFWHTSLKIDIS